MAVWNRLQGAIFGLGIGAATKGAVDPVLETVTQRSWGQRAVRVLQVTQAAQAEAQGIDHGVDYADDAKRQGIGRNRFLVLRDLTQTWPGVAELLTLWRRDPALGDDVKIALRRYGYSEKWAGELLKLKRVLPTVTDMVRFGVREVYNPAQRDFLDLDAEFPEAFADDAETIGLTRSTAKDYWAAHWELPSYGQLNEMLFRGELTREEYRDALKALDYAPTWRGKLAAIARRIPPLSDMTRFAVREVYDPAKRAALGLDAEYPEIFTAKAALHGMGEQDARDYWAAHWRLPSAEQGYKMLHRGEITLAQLDELLKAIDYPTLWRDRLRNIAYLVPGRVDLRRMLAEGVIDRGEVKRGYLNLGYTDVWAERLTDFAAKLAEKSKASGAADPTPHVTKAETQLWNAVHRAYIAGDASDAVATEKLAEAGVEQGERARVLAVWKHEREVIRARLTPAQLKKAWRKAVQNPLTNAPWTRDEALAELLDRGWNQQDANTFLDTPSGP